MSYPMILRTSTHIIHTTLFKQHRPGHLTETALLKVVNDLFNSLSKCNISALALIDFLPAFVTSIDHSIHVHRIHTDLGFTYTVLHWFSSYLTDRTQYVYLSIDCSAFAPVQLGVPQDSILGTMIFKCIIKLCLSLLIHT